MKKFILAGLMAMSIGCTHDYKPGGDAGVATKKQVSVLKPKALLTGTNPDYNIMTDDTQASNDLWSDILGDSPSDAGADSGKDDSIQWSFDNGATPKITYHGGPVMHEPVQLYLIFYGDWANSQNTLNIVVAYLSNLGATNWYKTNSQYYQDKGGQRKYVSSDLSVAKVVFDNYSSGKNLLDADVETVVRTNIKQWGLPVSSNAIYVVLGSKDMHQEFELGGKFCEDFCGWHAFSSLTPKAPVVDTSDSGTWEISLGGPPYQFPKVYFPSGQGYQSYFGPGAGNFEPTIKFIYTQDMSGCPDYSCSNQAILSHNGDTDRRNPVNFPNDDEGSATMVDVLSHEISEAIEDPELSSWIFDGIEYESADYCSWSYGKGVYKLPNGSFANIKVGDRDFLIQETYQLSSQSCVMP